MQKGICPNCDKLISKHSRTKILVCEEKFREKSKVPHGNQTIKVDGKTYDVDANFRQR